MKKSEELEILKEQLENLYIHVRREYKKKWKRDLPLEEILFDRWERARELGFGDKTSIYHNSYVYGKVKVGKNTWIGPFTILDGTGGISIGDNCSISSGVQIYSHNSVKWALSKGKEKYEMKPVKIESYCFIGPNSIIKSGITIGKHSVVGASSFVNKNVKPFSIVAGNPIKVIGKVSFRNNKVELSYFKYGKNK
jgi:acetyltransferase-like isoleucine patch superfamily enzyme